MKFDKMKQPIEATFKIGSPVSLAPSYRRIIAKNLNKSIEIKRISKNGASGRHSNLSEPRSLSELKSLPTKTWTDELLSFSTSIARQANACLERIKNNFSSSDLQFDANFRNHFLYMANNR